MPVVSPQSHHGSPTSCLGSMDSQMWLERCGEPGSTHSQALSGDFLSETISYICGAVIVKHHLTKDFQEFYGHPSNKPFGCVTVSEAGRFFAAGQIDPLPLVIIW
eukprot:Sdes_comp18134_c0_seq1m7604